MNSSFLSDIENRRISVISELDSDHKSTNGQFMTPVSIAMAMADMFETPSVDHIRLLDPGAGAGALSFAFIEMLIQRGCSPSSIQVFAYEIDEFLAEELRKNSALAIQEYRAKGLNLEITIIENDFISSAVEKVLPSLNNHQEDFEPFTHVIMNPPYLKISSASEQKSLVEKIGLRVNNLYSGFVGLSIALLSDSGHLVAITPRSFCNGPYFKPYRKFLLNNTAFKSIHLFERRDKVFTEDDVLQENVIFYLKKNSPRELVELSLTNGRSFSDINSRVVTYSQIVDPHDPELIIRIPANEFDEFVIERISVFSTRLESIGLQVSTGPVVDFRVKNSIHEEIREDSVPLIYPAHFQGQAIEWPLSDGRKPNSINVNSSTHKWLFPNQHFALVKRFSSKEEKRRIYPARYFPIGAFNLVGFENHLNIIHSSQAGIGDALAKGLVAYLSSTIVDLNFRQFSGHTQVNASDLRSFPFPPLNILIDLAQFHDGLTVQRELVDEYLEMIFLTDFSISSPNPVTIAIN